MFLSLNSDVFDFLNSFSHIPGINILADAPIFFLPVFLAGLWVYYTFFQSSDFNVWEKFRAKVGSAHAYYDVKRIDLLHIFYACLVGLLFSYIIKQFVDIERPESYLQQTGSLIMSTIPAKSFPSDHATVSFAFTIALLFTGFKRVGLIFLPFVIIMNLSRIIVGVHWPLDILAGTLVGTFGAVIAFRYIVPSKLVKNLDMLIIGVMKKLRLY